MKKLFLLLLLPLVSVAQTVSLGDFADDETIYVPFNTYGSDGESITITGLATTDIEIYKNGSVTQRSSDNGYALLDTDGIDFDGTTGLHGFSVDLSDNSDSGFYAAGNQYWLNVNSITVNGQTVNFTYYFRIIDSGWQDLKDGTTPVLTAAQAGAPYSGSIDGVTNQTTFSLDSGPATNDDLNNMTVAITGAGGGYCEREIDDYVASGNGIVIENACNFTVATNDTYVVRNGLSSEVNEDFEVVFDTDGVTLAATQSNIDIALGTDLDNLNNAFILKVSTCDSATSSTCVDATLTEADDYWKGAGIVFTSGAMAGKTSCVYDFTASSDELLFWDIGTSPGTGDFVLIANPICEAADDEGS